MTAETIILSTGNTMLQQGVGAADNSHTELTWSLRDNFEGAKHEAKELSQEKAEPIDWISYSDDGKTMYIPRLDFTNSSLHEERDQYDITAKVFFLSDEDTSARDEHLRQAVDLVQKELHMPNVDLLIVSFPGVYFDEESECCPDKIKSRGTKESSPEPVDNQLETWKLVEKLHKDGLVRRLGVSEFGANRLQPFLEKASVQPSVNQISLRDCCSVPQPLSSLAKSKNVELFVNNDSVNIMPRGTIRGLLDDEGAGVLSQASEKVGEKRKRQENGQKMEGQVVPQWVIKYTAVVKNRGVVENKGYFACAKYVEVEEKASTNGHAN
ncbi:Aldo/keto reductase, partial [Aureobasidium melanogenum]